MMFKTYTITHAVKGIQTPGAWTAELDWDSCRTSRMTPLLSRIQRPPEKTLQY